MASPFPHNATLIFQVGTPSTETDRMGNPLTIYTPLELTASLTLDRAKTARAIVEPGDDPNIAYLTGRCISPKYTPPSVRANSKAKCTIFDLATGESKSGEFTVTNMLQSRWAPVSKALGSKIEGYFIHA
jgi:hypothetical protein